MTKERKIGYAAMIIAHILFLLLFLSDPLQQWGEPPHFENLAGAIALYAALTVWPGYVLSVAILLSIHRVRPSMLFCTAMALILVGLLVFASHQSAGYGSFMQILGMLCIGLGFVSSWPFFRDVLSRY